jgi:VWFA-related protein
MHLGETRENQLFAAPSTRIVRRALLGSWKLGAGSCVCLGALVVGLGATPPEPQERAAGTIREGVTAVLVDVVVRDRRGQPVKDLTQADFEILEDGVAQTIGSFTPILEGLIAGAPAPAAPAGNAAAPGPAAPIAAGPAVTAIVFHGLSQENRKRAVQSAQTYLGEKEEMSNYVGIFGIDLSLVPLVPFTRNGHAVRQALNRIATGSSAGFNSPEMQQQRTNAESAAASASAAANNATGAAGAGNSGNVGTAAGDAKLAQMEASIMSGFQAMERNQSGYIATDALVAIVRTLGRVPGRKSVVLFSEGLEIPTDVARLFSNVMDAANRANVSIYTIDAAGLRAQSEQQKVRDMVVGAGGASEGGYSAEGGGSYTRGILEANENALRDPTTLLKQLALETGGQAFNNTNNLKPAFERVDSDLHNYYMLGYTPINTAFDGRFRTIQVKVKRSGVTIAARKGYFAVRNPGTSPVNEWETPALGALEQKPVPNAFPVRAGALLFPERGRPGLVPVVVEVKTEPLTFQPDKDGKSYTSDFTVLVRFLDGNKQVARKLSEHYQIRGDIAQLDRAKQGEVVFYRESELPAGVYSMETVVHDGPSGKSSVRFATVEVPRTEDNKLRMSSLVLVRRGDNVPEKDRRADNPLLVNGVALSPNLGDPVSRASKEATFYFAMYPGKEGSGPNVVIELLQNGKPVVQLPMPVPPADANGRIQQLGRLPIEQLAPGTYELRAVVKQGDQQVARSTMLRIVE